MGKSLLLSQHQPTKTGKAVLWILQTTLMMWSVSKANISLSGKRYGVTSGVQRQQQPNHFTNCISIQHTTYMHIIRHHSFRQNATGKKYGTLHVSMQWLLISAIQRMLVKHSDVVFPEKYYTENFLEIFWRISGNFPQQKNICSIFLYLTVLYSHTYFVKL